jgi:hypothetical protein
MSNQIPLPNSPALPIAGTGNTDIDDALLELNELENLDITDHADVYSRIHTKLNAALSDIDK